MTSIISFKKNVSFRSRPRWNNAGGDQRALEVIVRLIPTWPSSRRQPGILKTSPPHPPLGILRTSPHVPRTDTPRTHILRGPRMARPPTRKSGRNKKAASLRSRASLERLHPSRRCPCPQRSQYGSQGPEPSHLFQQ